VRTVISNNAAKRAREKPDFMRVNIFNIQQWFSIRLEA